MSTQIDRINEAMDVAIDAQEAGDFRTAEAKARTAWMLLSALPDSELADERLKWKAESVQPIVEQLARRAQSQARDSDSESRGALFRPVEITYGRG